MSCRPAFASIATRAPLREAAPRAVSPAMRAVAARMPRIQAIGPVANAAVEAAPVVAKRGTGPEGG